MKNTYVFIDSQNLFKTFERNGNILDMSKFYLYLKNNLKADKIFLFLGYINSKQDFYLSLKEVGYEIIFRPVVKNKDGYKANVDCDVVLHAVSKIPEYNDAVLVTNDGDYFNTVLYLTEKNKFKNVISPERKTCSKLLRRACQNKIIFLDDILLSITQNTPVNLECLEDLPTPRR